MMRGLAVLITTALLVGCKDRGPDPLRPEPGEPCETEYSRRGGVRINIAVEGEAVVYEPEYEGKYLADHPKRLDAIARVAGKRTILSLLSSSSFLDTWDTVLEPVGAASWHPAEEVSATLSAILSNLSKPACAAEADWQEGVTWSLRSMLVIAERAEREGKLVHFWLDV